MTNTVKTQSLKPKLKSSLSAFRRNERGNVAIITAISMLVMLGGLALAIDLSRGWFAKQRLQDTTDVIALLAVKDGLTDKSELQAAADSIMAMHYPDGEYARIEIVDIKRNGDTVRVEATHNIDTYFAPVLNKNDLNVRVASSATYAEQSLEIALVLDTTGSMRGSKISSLKSAAIDLIDRLDEDGNGKVKMSVVPFAQYVNVGDSQVGAPWLINAGDPSWRGCVGSRIAPYDTRPDIGGDPIPAVNGSLCGAELQPMTDKLDQAKTTVTRMRAAGWTYMPAGLIWGWRTLDEKTPFPNKSEKNAQRVLVMMTDGTNTRSKSGLFHEGRDTMDANAVTADICEKIKRDKIVVYTIAYEISNTDTKQLVSECATDLTKFFDAENAGDLRDAFDKIGDAVTQLRLAS